jgi:hypothetical protein
MDDTEDPTRPAWLDELDPESIASALGRVLASNPESSLWSDPRFIAWLRARAHEAGEPIDEREAAQLLEREGSAMIERLRRRGKLS